MFLWGRLLNIVRKSFLHSTNMNRKDILTKSAWSLVTVFLVATVDVAEHAMQQRPSRSAKELGKLYSGDVWKYVSNLEHSTSKRFDQMESRLLRSLEERIRLVNHSASIDYLERFMLLLNEQLADNEEQLKASRVQVDEMLRKDRDQDEEIEKLKRSIVELHKTVAKLMVCVEEECASNETTVAAESQTTDSVSQTTATTTVTTTETKLLPIDCQEALASRSVDLQGGFSYQQIKPRLSEAPFKACCYSNYTDLAWTVIQRRFDGSVEFYRNWDEYKEGFGDVGGGEFWLGNDRIYQLTNQGDYRLRIEMKTWDDEFRWAEYRRFRVADETDKYRLRVNGYSGDAGNSLSSPWDNDHSGQPFSTYDADNDDRFYDNCAEHFRGAWWFRSCFKSHLNGVYYPKGLHDDFFVRNGIQWNSIHPHSSLREVTMMIRRRADDDDDDDDEGVSNGIERGA